MGLAKKNVSSGHMGKVKLQISQPRGTICLRSGGAGGRVVRRCGVSYVTGASN